MAVALLLKAVNTAHVLLRKTATELTKEKLCIYTLKSARAFDSMSYECMYGVLLYFELVRVSHVS